MKQGTSFLRILLLFAVTAGLTACASSPPSRFYTLNSLAVPETEQPAGKGANPLYISIMPVEIPDYLDRPQIVTRDGQNKLKLAAFDRWAGSLSDSISTVLAENLALLLGTDHVFVTPGHKADYSVDMRVLGLDCFPGDHVRLKAQWSVYAGDDLKEVATHISTITEKVNNVEFDAMVAAVSRTIEQVSRQIASTMPAR